jgi:hypothetical protein
MRLNQSVPSLLFAFFFAPASDAASLPDTGQTLCYNGSNVMEACSNTNSGDASTMPRQDGRFGRDPAAGVTTKVGGGAAGFDYSKVANDGTTLAASAVLGSNATDWACTQDNITGLMWEVKTTDGGLRDKTWAYSWYNSDGATNAGIEGWSDSGDSCFDSTRCDTEKYVADVNAATLCGHSDWRLPSKRELETITHLGSSAPAIESTYFPNTIATSFFWSASSYVPDPTYAWVVSFSDGDDLYVYKAGSYSVRLVRGGQF